MPTISLELSPDVDERLRKKAASIGLDTGEYLLRVAERIGQPKQHPQKPRTGEELVASLKALKLPAGYGDPNIGATDLAQSLRRQAESRDWT